VEAHEEPESINWPEFRDAFRAHHVPQGVIKLKKEFQDLKQGSMSVNEYVTKFTQLSRYAPNELDTDEKKQDCFLNGLNNGLDYALEAQHLKNFQGMVNKALVLENRRGVMKGNCKLMRQHQPGSSSRPCVGPPSVSWARILYFAASTHSVSQQFLDSCYWKLECSEGPSYSRPNVG
jgi:hypothetical protein